MKASVYVGRVGGLALALGIGVGVSIACGPPVGAAPGQGSPDPSATAEPSPARGGATTQRTRQSRGTPVASEAPGPDNAQRAAVSTPRELPSAAPGNDAPPRPSAAVSLKVPAVPVAAGGVSRRPGDAVAAVALAPAPPANPTSATATPAALTPAAPAPDASAALPAPASDLLTTASALLLGGGPASPVESPTAWAAVAAARSREDQGPLGAAATPALNPRITATYTVGVEPRLVVADPRGRWVYTINERGEKGTDREIYASISVLDTVTKTVTTYSMIPSGCGCDGRFTDDVAITPDGTLYLFGLEEERALVDVGNYVVGATARESGFQWREIPSEDASALGSEYGGFAIKSVAGAVSFDAKTVITGLIATKAVPRTLSYKEVDEDRGLQPFYDPRTETLKEYDTQAFLGYIDTALVAGLPLGEGSGGTVSDGDEDEGAVPTRPQGSIPKTMIPGAEGQRVGPILNWANTKGWEDIGLTVNDVELVGPASSGIAWLVGTKDPRKARGRAAAVPWVASVITSTGATAYVKLPSDFTGSGVRLKELSLAKTPSGSRIFVGGSKIAVIDGASRALITTIDLLPDTPFNNSNGASIIDMAVSPDGKYLFALNSDSDPARKLFFVIDIATNAVLKTLTLDTLNGTGYASDMAVSTDGKRVYITTDSSSGAPYSASILSEIDLYAPAPTGTATIGTPEVSTGVVAGRVTTSGLGGSMTYTPTTPAKGTVSITNAGAFTFTPSAAAMHAAARNGAATAEKTDTFTVTVRDSQGSRVDVPVTVTIVPRNTPPADVRASVGSPDTSTGVVTGTVSATDADRDSLTFSVPATTAGGGITINAATGAFTYTPTLAARQNAGKPGATAADKSDSFTVTVSDGYGGSRSTAVAVAISPVAPPANSPPVPGTPTTTTNTSTGVVSGKVNATDPNGDSVTYTATTISTAKGRVTVTGAGTFTYTPTAAARHAAARSGATSADKADTFTVTASDGRGASAGIPVTVTVSPKNTAPSGVRATVGTPNTTTGVVTGRVSATDADRDPLTFSAPATTSKGAISITASSGAFTYTPTLAARQNAGRPGAGTADRSDSFIVTIADGYGGSARVTVSVTIRPA